MYLDRHIWVIREVRYRLKSTMEADSWFDVQTVTGHVEDGLTTKTKSECWRGIDAVGLENILKKKIDQGKTNILTNLLKFLIQLSEIVFKPLFQLEAVLIERSCQGDVFLK